MYQVGARSCACTSCQRHNTSIACGQPSRLHPLPLACTVLCHLPLPNDSITWWLPAVPAPNHLSTSAAKEPPHTRPVCCYITTQPLLVISLHASIASTLALDPVPPGYGNVLSSLGGWQLCLHPAQPASHVINQAGILLLQMQTPGREPCRRAYSVDHGSYCDKHPSP
jgi:hypothetical protein